MPAASPGTLSARWCKTPTPRSVPSANVSGALSSVTTCSGSSCEGRMAVPTGVRVAVRIRPLLAREAGQRQGVRSYPSQSKIVLTGLDRGQEKCFIVDSILDSRPPMERSSGGQTGSRTTSRESFPMDGSQEAVYEAVGAEIVRKAVEGYNACMLAYGHTGSGKTYTVMGSEFTRDLEPDDLSPLQCDAKPVKGTGTPRTSVREKVSASPLEKGPADSSFDMDVGFGSGLVPRTLEAIFNALSEEPDTVCVASFYEIHNERIRDLLAPATPKEAPAWQDGGSGGQPRNGRVHGKTTVHFHPRFGAFVAGVEEVPCDDVQEALRLVSFGLQVRTTAATMLNDRSSRSHAIFSLRMERSTSSNSIMLVDLAGREQERLSMCRTERFKELTLINRSLFHLAHCVRELAASQVGAGTANSAQQHGKESAQWHHFRNSKLTMVLGHALAGNSHTAVVGTISPAQISFEDSLATLRFCESVKQVRTKPALPVSHREDVVMELQDEVRRLELELLRARSGRAIVERQLGEAQAMMEHYRCSWKQALEMSGHAELAKVRREAQDAVQLPGVPSFAASGSGNWSPCSGTPGSAEVPLASATGGGSVPASPASRLWRLAEAGTGGPPAFHREETAETAEAGDGDVSPSAGSAGHLSRSTSAEPRHVPPLPLSLVEAQVAKPAEASAARLPSVGSDASSRRPSPCSPTRSVLSRFRSADSPTGRDSQNALCDVDRAFWSPQPDTPSLSSLPSTPRLQTRQIGFQQLQQQPRLLLRSGAAAHPSSSAALPGARGLPRPSVVYGLTNSYAPQVVSRLLASSAPAELSGCQVLSVPAPVPAENELMRACEQSLAEAERSNDWRKQELAVTLRHLRSQLLDINASTAATRVRRATSPSGAAAAVTAVTAVTPATASARLMRAPQTPRSGNTGAQVAPLVRTLSPPPSSPATPMVHMRPFIQAASPTSPPTPRVTSPAPVATAGAAVTPAFYTAEAAALMEDRRPPAGTRSAALSVQRMRGEDLPLTSAPPPAWVAPLATAPAVLAVPPTLAARPGQTAEAFSMMQESATTPCRAVVSDAPAVCSWSRAAVHTPIPSRQIIPGPWAKAPAASDLSPTVSPWLSPKAEDLPCPFQPSESRTQ